MDIFRKICIDKGLDASRYEVRLTKLPNQPVDMSQSLSDYQTNEITIVQCSGIRLLRNLYLDMMEILYTFPLAVMSLAHKIPFRAFLRKI